MQRMVRQLAAEYTSKKTPTQDPTLPNSTKNQSLSKSSPVQSSPTAATTRNPVLSKLLMADQESPLDLTVKKSQLESKEQDGVLDLSTKKSPSFGCSSPSPSPSGSSTLGNGDKTTPTEVIHQKTQKTPTLETLMVTLCPHHQKQYVHALSDLDTEEQLSPENINTSACSLCDAHYSNMPDKVAVFPEEMVNVSPELHVNHSDSHNSTCVCCQHLKKINTKSSIKVICSDGEKCCSTIKEESTDLSAGSFGTPVAVFTPGCFAVSNKLLNVNHISESVDEDAAAATSEPTSDVKNSVEEEHSQEKTPVNCYVEVKMAPLNVDHGSSNTAAQNTLLKALSEETLDSDVIMCLPKKLDKANLLQSKTKASLKQDLEINESPVSPNQESLTAQGRHKVGNHLHHGTNGKIDYSKDSWPTLRKTSNRHARMKSAPDAIKTVRNCKRASGVRINDFDNQCDVVYISQPITECQFENQRSILSSRKTARKSTRGYLFNGDYCEISTVRTLFRSSKAVDILNCSKLIKERLVFPNQSLSTTLPLMQMAVVANPEKADINVTSVDVSLPESPCHQDKYEVSTIADEPKVQFEPCDSALLVTREAASSPLMAILSHEEKTQEDLSEFQCKAVNLPSNVKYEEDAKLVKGFTIVPEELKVCTEPLNKIVLEVSSIETPVSIHKEKGFVDSNTAYSKSFLNNKLNSDAESITQIIVDNTAYPEIATPIFPFVPFEKEPLEPLSGHASVESVEELHTNSSNDPTFEDKNCAQSRSTESLDTSEFANVEGSVDITPAFSSMSSLEECHIDSRLNLSFQDAQDHLVDCRSPYSPEGSYGEDSVDFTLALSLEDTPRKDHVGSTDDFSTEDAHVEAPVETTYEPSSEDIHGDVSDNHLICPIEKSSDSKGASFSEENREVPDSLSFFDVSNEKEVLDSIATTLDLHSDDNVANGDLSPSILSVKEALDFRSTSPFPISDDNRIECFGDLPLSEDDLGTELVPATLSELSVREKDICIKPASPSQVITGEGAINVAPVSPSYIAKTDECGGNVSASPPATSIRKAKKSPKPHNTSKRSAVNACSNKSKKQQSPPQGKVCKELIGNSNLKKVKKVGAAKSETVQDNHKKSEPLKKHNVDKNVLKKKSKKRKKSKVIKSDRRLRSQFLQSAAVSSNECSTSSHFKVPCLKIKLVKGPGAKRFQRTVYLHKALSVNFPLDCFNKTLLEKMGDSNVDDSEDSADEYPITRQSYKNIRAKSIAESDTVLSESESNLAFIHNNPAEGLQIQVDMNTNQRKVQLPLNCLVKKTQNTERTVGHINTLELNNIESKTVIVASKIHDSLVSSQRFHNDASGNAPKLSRTFMKQKNLILRNHNLRLASKMEKIYKKDLTAENSKVVSAKEENDASPGKEENLSRKTLMALNEEPQENSKVKFTNCLAEEENQELIADFNAKYMKVQKGWIILEKEAMPMHRTKNKSDKLKEIWKTKKRVRKIRNSSEAQKLSPIQILFMKAFKLSDICKWFLETTETKSLVIVKKVSSRLPGDFPMPMIPIQRGASSIGYPPSAQAERLKKHLKKFAAASPLKNNSKTQKMWAKFRGPFEDSDSSTSTSSSPNTDLDVVNDHRNAKSTQNVKTPACARILRKYSNMRGKLRAQNCLVNSEKSSDIKALKDDEKKPSKTNVCLTPLVSPKSALQVKNDVSCDDSEGDLKSKKGKKQSLHFPKSDTEPDKKKRKQDSSNTDDSPISSVKVRPIVKKVSSKVEPKDSQMSVPSTRRKDTLDCTGKGSKTASIIENKAKAASKNVVQTENLSLRGNKNKGKTNTGSRALLATSPKVEGAKVSSCKSQKMSDGEPHEAKTRTRSMKAIVNNCGFEEIVKLRSKPRPFVHTKRRRLVTK